MSPLEKWEDPGFERHAIEVFWKRDDLPDPWSCGNKRRKLKYLLTPEILRGKQGVYSWGGPFSNHLAALAAIAREAGIPSAGILRGDPVDNPVIQRLREDGMHLRFAGRQRWMDTAPLVTDPENWLPIPMGGAHPLALEGCREIVEEIRAQAPGAPTHYAVAAGTGTTAAGMAAALHPEETLWVFPAVRDGDLNHWLHNVLGTFGVLPAGQVVVDDQAPRTGFARRDPVLWSWMAATEKKLGFLLDPLYTAKMAIRIPELVVGGAFPRHSRLILIHTGGLPGRNGYAWRFGCPT